MAQTQVEYPPLTFSELKELLSRHEENAAVAKVIKDAIQRRLDEPGIKCKSIKNEYRTLRASTRSGPLRNGGESTSLCPNLF